jgi:predicted transposase YbfD/YdcC
MDFGAAIVVARWNEFFGPRRLVMALAQTSVVRHFGGLNDPRREGRRLHNLCDMIAIALCAVICGAESWEDVAEYGRQKEPWLKTFLRLPNGVPSHDTFNRVFRLLKPKPFQACFARWMQGLVEATEGRIVAIDGKTLRHSFDRAADKSALHMISAWAVANGVSLGQRAVDGDSNEITAVPELLKLLELEGAIVTYDAMGCQKEIAQAIRDQGADYVLAVKENQPRLYEDILTTMENAFEGDRGETYRLLATDDKGHGRTERREYVVVRDLSKIRDRDLWADLRAVAMVCSERTVDGKTSTETRYYISSCSGSVRHIAGAIRGHWGIENSLHWSLDVTFGEDAHCLRKDHGPENMATLRRAALSLVKQERVEKGSLRRKRLRAGWNNAYLEKLLNCGS